MIGKKHQFAIFFRVPGVAYERVRRLNSPGHDTGGLVYACRKRLFREKDLAK
jgi:hypothetical protein